MLLGFLCVTLLLSMAFFLCLGALMILDALANPIASPPAPQPTTLPDATAREFMPQPTCQPAKKPVPAANGSSIVTVA